MPIVVAHEPAYPVVGAAAYGIGRGMAKERLDEQLRRQAEQDARRDFEARQMERQAELQAERDARLAEQQAERDIWQAEVQAGRDEQLAELQAEREARKAEWDWNVSQGRTPWGDPLPEPKYTEAQEMERLKLAEDAFRVQSDMTLDPMEKTVMLGKLNQKYDSIQPEVNDVRAQWNRRVLPVYDSVGNVIPGVVDMLLPDGSVKRDASLAQAIEKKDVARQKLAQAAEAARFKATAGAVKTEVDIAKFLVQYRAKLEDKTLTGELGDEKFAHTPEQVDKMVNAMGQLLRKAAGLPEPALPPPPPPPEPPAKPPPELSTMMPGLAPGQVVQTIRKIFDAQGVSW